MVFLSMFLLVFVLFAARLFNMQIIETKGDTNNMTTYTSLTRVKAARGDILDRNGNILVGNRASYDLVFNHYVIESASGVNKYLYNLVKKCQELGVEYYDHFPVTQTQPFEYTHESFKSAWRGYFQNYMKDREIDSDISASLLVQKLRKRYELPEEWTDEEARAVIGLRYEFDLRGVANLSNYVFIEDISDEHLSTLLELNTPGLMVESSTVREYHTTYAAHILGYVSAMNESQWKEFKDKGYAMDAWVGQTGFEKAFEEELHAIDGTRVDVVDREGTIIEQYWAKIRDEDKNVIGYKVPQAGNNVETTLDINLQKVAEDELAKAMQDVVNPEINKTVGLHEGLDAQGAAVVVMEVKTGDILAMASYPTFNLATFNEDYEALSQDKLKPMYNRALQGAYPPGSTFKMAPLIAAMNNGIINAESEIEDKGLFTELDFNRSCLLWSNTRATHGFITAAEALECSCNYFFYELGYRLSWQQLNEVSAALGLGEPTGVELPENVGWRADPDSKRRQHGEHALDGQWFPGDEILSAIGQSENRFTPLQLCVYACTLANRGTRMQATFLNRVVSSDYRTLVEEKQPKVLSTYEICNDAYVSYMEGMQRVLYKPLGTARKFFNGFNDEEHTFPADIRVCAKTGTAQTFESWSDHGAFICFAPAENPEIAVALYGERIAHPTAIAGVAEAIMKAYFTAIRASTVDVYENQLS
jgi:penicillin-binding protein 2